MAKLPRSPIAANVQNNYRPVKEARASGADPVGQAMEQAGNAGFEIASRIREAHITSEVASAQNDLRLRLDGEYRALQADSGPPEELEAKFAARAKEVVGETAGSMSSPMHKRLFEAQSAELANAYTIKTRDLTRQKQLQGARALAMHNLDGLVDTAADPDISRDVLEENAANALANARRQFSIGVFTADQLAEAEIKADTALKYGISIRNVKRIEEYIDAADPVSLAKAQLLLADDKDNKFRSEILPEKREALEEVLRVKAEQSTAYAQADTAYTNADKNEADALVDLRARITDIDTLKTAEARVRQLAADDRDAETDRANDATNKGWDIIVQGGSLSSIPASVLAEIPGATKKIMQNEVESRRARDAQGGGGSVGTDRSVTAAYYELLARGDYTAARTFVHENAAQISDSDFESMLSKAAKANEKKDPRAIASARSLTEATAQALRNFGMDDDPENKGELLQAYDKRYQAYQAAEGGEPDDAWRDATLEELASGIKITKPGPWFNDVGNVDKGRFRIESAGEVPNERVQAVIAAFPDTTRVAASVLDQHYSKAISVFEKAGINPTNRELTAMIISHRNQDARREWVMTTGTSLPNRPVAAAPAPAEDGQE